MADKGKGIADDYSSGKRKRDGDDKSGNRKRKNLSVLQFFEDAAFEESGSSDDDDFINDDINMYFEDDLGADLEVKTEPKTPNIPFFPKEEEMDEEEMDKLLEARYKPGANFVKYSEDRTEPTRFDEQNAFMPFAKDPTIWKVKCTVGRERHSVFCLMQKFVDLQLLGTKLQIVSAFAVEHVKGFIYIEAEKQFDINEACKGLCNIYPSRVSSVPLSEVPHLFSVRSKYSGVSVDTWARVKNGKYKGDLAQVVNVNEAKRKATVKLVPRIDLQAVAEKFGGGVTGKKSTIPAPRLITSSELEAYGPLVQRKHDRETNDVFEVFDGMTLKDGYLYKKVNLDSLSFWDVRPSEAELIKFSPANKEESNDVEWLTGIFGERKKKKPTISNDKTGGKGEGSSSSSIENSFEVPDLVFHGRKGFGIVIGREKDDRIKVLGEGSDKPLVVVVEARLLKKADFDKKLTAFDQHKKIISTNDTVRVLEGPLEDKRGLVKHIYKGVVFLHDENESENCGYFCAKAQICEKMDFGSDLYKGKGGKSDASGFDDFPRSPKSPLSPNKPWEGKENNRNFDRDDKDGFSVGQSCRIRVGPLKGYMCRVMAIRYSDITVKLDSQHKILTVKSEHLAEVKGKSSGVSIGDGQDSAKPFELLGENGGAQGWMDAGASESGGGGWNIGNQPTERSSWAPFSANPFNSVDNDSSKDAGASAWETKTTQDNNSTPWGASATENKSGGWGASSSGVKDDNSNDAGWGAAKLNVKEPDATPWGNAASNDNGENQSAWNSAPAPVIETGGWGSTKKDENTTGWGSTKKDENTTGWGSTKKDENTTGWGKQTAGGSSWGKEDGGGSSWGKQAEVEKGESDGWNKKSSDSGWGNKLGSDGGSKDDVDGAGGWGKKPSVTGGESGKWASADKEAEGGSGWGNNKDGVSSSSWSKPAGGGGSSWGNQDSGSWSKQDGGRGGGNACFKCGETGHMSRECPQGGGGGGSRSCYKCGETGHMSRECPQGGGGGGSKSCFKCGETGHMSRECPQGGGGGSGGGRSCYKCGEEGHMSRECPQGGGGGGGRSCYKCGEEGHMSRECPQGGGGGGGRSCYKCGEEGHMSRECPQGGGGGGGGGGRNCYKCGETGHMSRECPQGGGGGGGKSCYKCGESGHMSRECPQGAGGASGGGGRSCYKCGESGHMSRECPQGGGGGGGTRSCYKCGETGHMSRECPQGGGGGGGSGGGSRSCYKCGEAGHMSRECPQGGGGGGSYGGGGGWSSGGWGSNKGSDASEKKEDGQSSGGGGWSSGGWGSNKASDAAAGKKDDGQSSTGGWGSNAGAGKKDDANVTQLGSSGWGSDAGKKPDAQGSGWGGEQTGKKEGWGSIDQAGGWGESSKDPAKKDGAEESGWKKSGW